MATNFPGSLDSFTDRTNGQTIDASHVDDLQDAVEALEAAATKRLNPTWAISPAAVAFAWKGNRFVPTNSIRVNGIIFNSAALATNTVVQGAIVTVDGSSNVATITTTSAFSTGTAASGSYGLYLPFASPVALTGGSTYHVFAGYNAGASVTGTSDIPIWATAGNALAAAVDAPAGTWTVGTVYRMNTLAPTVGTAVGTSTGSTGTLLMLGLVGRWA